MGSIFTFVMITGYLYKAETITWSGA